MNAVPLRVRAAAELELRRRSLTLSKADNIDYRGSNPSEFAAARLKVMDKSKQLVPFAYNRAQRDLMGKLTGHDLILKARQLGMSTAIQGLLYQRAVSDTATTMTLAHDDDGTKTLRRMADRFHRNDPQAPKRGAANDRLSTYPAHDSEALIATAGNRTSGRSTSLSHLHGSEVAFWPDAESIVAGAMQAGNPEIILESTPNGAQGYFYTLCMEALSGDSPWTLHFYPWWWDDGYQLALDDGETLTFTAEESALMEQHDLTAPQIKWRRAKQAELKQLFAQEYPEDPVACFLTSGAGYFGDVSDVFTAPLDPKFDSTHRYVAGLDFGQTNDPTAFTIIDASVSRQVASGRWARLPWLEMRRRVVEMCKTWNVRILVAEANSMGSTNIEALEAELKAAKLDTKLISFTTTNASKYLIMGNLNATLHDEHGLKLQDEPIQRHELAAFQAKQLPSGAWQLAAPDGEHDDTVIRLALAWHAVSKQPIRATTGRYA